MISKTNIFPIQILAAENFPRALKSIPNAPKQLYYRGTLPDFKHSWIAMVGTRRPSIHAEEICRALVKNLIDTDAIVVSGLAQGIDSFCHSAALEFHIPTVAVIAQGLDAPLGGSRKMIADKILENGGTILSEYPGSMISRNFMFPQRNRIIAGLSRSITLVESKLQGGGMITVDYAEKFQRRILALPGNILAETAQGPNFLIAKGKAHPIWNASDFSALCGAKRLSDQTPADLLAAGIELSENAKNLFSKNAGFTHSLDELCTSSSIPVSSLLAILTELEIAGLVHSKDGDAFHFSSME